MRRIVHVTVCTEFYNMLEKKRVEFQNNFSRHGLSKKLSFVELTRILSKPKPRNRIRRRLRK